MSSQKCSTLGTITKCERRRRAVIIIPELTFNLGRINIAEKVGRFINSHTNVVNFGKHKLVDRNIPYAEMLKSTKWANKGCKESEAEKIIKQGDRICINDSPEECSEVSKSF
uniref:Putative ovule protein n=1 Tax=Solanum chacoense TaxID=4108 RepID=A0A0V0HGL0_SOLCH